MNEYGYILNLNKIKEKKGTWRPRLLKENRRNDFISLQ